MCYILLCTGAIKNTIKKAGVSMPRKARNYNKTITNTYHIMIRGINKQNIFLDNQDREKFIKEIILSKQKYDYEIYAYILMVNHVHLVISDPNDCVSEIMKDICGKYAMYFNNKYERVGHVFQNRFKNLCIDTEEYLLRVIRYVHKNPEAGGIESMQTYKWSSYNDYFREGIKERKITDTKFVLELLNENDSDNAKKKFKEFHGQLEKKYSDAEFEFEKTLSDEQAIDCIRRILNIDNILQIQNYSKKIRDEYICRIAEIKGIYPKQMSRLLGMGERNIQMIIKQKR